MGDYVFVDRPPRIQPELPFASVEIPVPPPKEENPLLRLVQIGLPMLTIIGSVLTLMMNSSGSRNPAIIIPMLLGVLATTGLGVYSYLQEQQKRATMERAYAQHLAELHKDMQNYHDLQRRYYAYNYPEPAAVLRVAKDARWEVEKEKRTLRGDTRLWERRTADADFGAVRLGMGTLPATAIYKLRDPDNFDDPQVRAALKLQEASRYVDDIPVIIQLRHAQKNEQAEKQEEANQPEEKAGEEVPRTPATAALGIAGESGAVYEFVRALLAGYIVFHAPHDARLYVVASRRAEWLWTDAAPHCADDETTQYRCFLDDQEEGTEATLRGEEEESSLQRFLEGIRKLLAQRRLQIGESEHNEGQQADPTLPFLLVVVDLLDSAGQGSPLDELESDAGISILVEDGAALGASVIFLVSERSKIPGGCKSVIEIERTVPATNTKSQGYQKLHFRFAEIGLNTFRYVGEADALPRQQDLIDLAQRLAEVGVRQSAGAGIKSAVPFMELMGYGSMPALRADAWRRWQDTIEPGRADWLRARLGLVAGNKPRTLIFSAKRDGADGMVAGSTGSGKSELLISLLTGMAVSYDPTVLNFVLVDYKGGGTFKGFEDLPHCVDMITNLGAEGVTRMFTAINTEMRRRQKLNADTGTKNIVEYRQKGLHRTFAPYPFLFIIIDEFAEMIADRAEFKNELESITRVGRAQGVSLILAAQRPSGVTDQMRSNIKFRICLPRRDTCREPGTPAPDRCRLLARRRARSRLSASRQRRDRADPGGLHGGQIPGP